MLKINKINTFFEGIKNISIFGVAIKCENYVSKNFQK